MHIPISLTVVLFLAAFILTAFQYYRIDPRRRVLNLRFPIMATAAAGACSLPFVAARLNQDPALQAKFSVIYLVVAVICLGASYLLFRRMPPRQ